LYGAVKPVPENEKQSIIVMNQLNQSNWKVQDPAYPVEIVGYTSDKKYHGVKKFTSYEIQTKAFNAKVKRRYNHFDWLHKRLVEKYPNVCIPSLPDKAVTGNFEDEFILKRKAQLELWLNRMSSHPVVGRSEVFVHFLQCDDTSSKWKSGKRKAEKDEYRGAQWFCTLTVPGISIDSPVNLKERVDKFSKASMQMDASVKNVHLALDKINTFNASYKRELTFMGKKLEELGTSIAAEPLDAPNNNLLSSALVTAGNTYTQIGNMYGEQAKSDINPLMDRIGLFRSILHEMPDIVQFEKNAIQTYEEFHQRPEKLEGRNLMEVGPRLDIVSHVTFAEINLFNRDKVDDLTRYMKQFLQQQIAFYTDVTTSLKTALAKFEQIPSSGSTNNKK
jgi:sorting nexin-9/18/33